MHCIHTKYYICGPHTVTENFWVSCVGKKSISFNHYISFLFSKWSSKTIVIVHRVKPYYNTLSEIKRTTTKPQKPQSPNKCLSAIVRLIKTLLIRPVLLKV